MKQRKNQEEKRSVELPSKEKFPRTQHLFDVGGSVSRDDLLLTERDAQEWLARPLVLEEKVDGANLGISLSSDQSQLLFQNRSHYVTSASHVQFKQLDSWVRDHTHELWQILLAEPVIIFGEWLYAKHSIHYTRLPDLFLVFDIFDKLHDRFLSREERDKRLESTTIKSVPLLGKDIFSKEQLLQLLEHQSSFYDGPLEGIYIRREEDGYLTLRSKIVRPSFLQSEDMETHWSKHNLVKNIIDYNYFS